MTSRLVICASLAIVLLGGCDTCRSSGQYLMGVSYSGLREVFGHVAWDEAITSDARRGDPETVRVWLPLGATPEREMLEFFDEAGAQLAVAGTLRRGVFDSGESCAMDALDYDLSAFPSGTYAMVHRRSSAPAGLGTTQGPWDDFDGERALVAELVLTREDAAALDAGLP